MVKVMRHCRIFVEYRDDYKVGLDIETAKEGAAHEGIVSGLFSPEEAALRVWAELRGFFHLPAEDQTPDPPPEVVKTDCQTETGITVGLIDTLLTVSNVLSRRDCTTPEAQAALRDLQSNAQLRALLQEGAA